MCRVSACVRWGVGVSMLVWVWVWGVSGFSVGVGECMGAGVGVLGSMHIHRYKVESCLQFTNTTTSLLFTPAQYRKLLPQIVTSQHQHQCPHISLCVWGACVEWDTYVQYHHIYHPHWHTDDIIARWQWMMGNDYIWSVCTCWGSWPTVCVRRSSLGAFWPWLMTL